MNSINFKYQNFCLLFVIGFLAHFGDSVNYFTGNITYQNSIVYDVFDAKNIIIKLVCLSGDADLYIFNSNGFERNKIDFSNYISKSDSYGIEQVHLGGDIINPVKIVIYGSSQNNAEFRLEVSYVAAEASYESLDYAVQKGVVGCSYEELSARLHSFDSDALYREEEEIRRQLLSSEYYPDDANDHLNNKDGKRSANIFMSQQSDNLNSNKKHLNSANDRTRSAHKTRNHLRAGKRFSQNNENGDTLISNFLLWLLEFLVDVIF